MNKLEEQEVENKEVQVLKSQIGFGTAFKATLGFYAAQFVATIAFFAILGVLGLIALAVLYFVFK
jgi:hypothetical protein